MKDKTIISLANLKERFNSGEQLLLKFLHDGHCKPVQKPYSVAGTIGRVIQTSDYWIRATTVNHIGRTEDAYFGVTHLLAGPKNEFASIIDPESSESREFFDKLGKAKKPAVIEGTLGKGSLGNTGSDPEVFALSKEGVVIPAFSWLPSKHEKVGSEPFWDGFQAEFNPIPSTCLQGHQSYIRDCLQKTMKKLVKIDKDARLYARGVVDVSEETLETLPDEFVALGCLASNNVYADETHLEVPDPRKLLFRTAGCHIHLGVGNFFNKNLSRVVKTLDSVAGVMMVSLFRGMEDPRRRTLYGRAGEYRLPSHGVEYRVPPAEVLSHPVTYMLCFDMVRLAAYFGNSDYYNVWEAEEREVRDVINFSDVAGADKILKRNKDVFRGLLKGLYNYSGSETMTAAETLVSTGAKNWLPLDRPLEENWFLCGDRMSTTRGGTQVSNIQLKDQREIAMASVA